MTIIREFNQNLKKGVKIKTISEVSSQLKVQNWHIRHVISAGYIDRPMMIGGRYVFDDQEITTLNNYFYRKEPQNETTINEIFNE